MFSKHAERKVVRMTITYTDPTDVLPIPEPYEDMCDIPCTPSLAAASQITEVPISQPTEPTSSKPTEPTTSLPNQPSTSTPSTNNAAAADDDDDYLANPEPHNEHVGVDDECLYLTATKATSEGSGSESDSQSDEEYEEEDGLVGKDPPPPLPIVCYDRNDPPMSVGSIYPSMREFKLALNHHAIKYEFEYNTEKSDPGRLRAYCSRKKEEGCRWKLHNRIWARSQFWTTCKVDYVTNNLAECFNNWIKKYKALNLDDLMDKLRQLIMNKWDVRRTISRKIEGSILPHIIKDLKEQSFNLDMEVQRSGDMFGEVVVKGGSGFKCVVDIDKRICTCRKWDVTGIPCKHAIAFITSLGQPLEKYVDMYYSVQNFRAAYETLIPAMTDKDQWPQSDHGFFMHPPLLKSTAGRRHNERFKGCGEAGGSTSRKKGSHQCPICKGYGHRWYNCKNGDPQDIEAMHAEKGPPKRRKKNVEPPCESTIVPFDSTPKTMHFPHSQSVSASLGSQSLRETTPPPATSMPDEGKKKPKGKAKAQGRKNKKKNEKKTPVLSGSPALSTRSKTTQSQSPAAHTRSKRKLPY